jgi:hypothetical protein
MALAPHLGETVVDMAAAPGPLLALASAAALMLASAAALMLASAAAPMLASAAALMLASAALCVPTTMSAHLRGNPRWGTTDDV